MILKAPFPWFGGKSRAADLIWPRLGNTPNYVEPFFGSGAVLLRRPHAAGNEIVNDLDCYVANAWRAVKLAPEETAGFCDWPVNEADLHARHRWLHGRAEFRERMKNEPDFYDSRIAGYWIWGLSCWIGDNFCRPKNQEALPHLTGGQGVARQVPHLTGGKGNAMTIEDISSAPSASPEGRSRGGAQSVAIQVPRLRAGGGGVQIESGDDKQSRQTENLIAWFNQLSSRLRHTKVVCGSWERVCTKASTYGQGLTAVLLDPPYDAGDSHDDVYGDMSRGISAPVREWAIEAGKNPLMRVALCGYEGEHQMPPDWDCIQWKASGGYASAAGNAENSSRERIWFSPHCLNPEPNLL